jgi:hypothetical protein
MYTDVSDVTTGTYPKMFGFIATVVTIVAGRAGIVPVLRLDSYGREITTSQGAQKSQHSQPAAPLLPFLMRALAWQTRRTRANNRRPGEVRVCAIFPAQIVQVQRQRREVDQSAKIGRNRPRYRVVR